MKSPITQAIDTLISESVAPMLKAQGFKKKAQRFWRNRGDAIQLVEFDRGKYNVDATGKFGISVGVFYPAVWKMVCELRPGWGTEFSVEYPPIQNCLLSECLSPPDIKPLDQYWDIDATRDNRELVNAVNSVIEMKGLVWLTSHTPIKQCFPRLSELSAKGEWLSAMYLFCGALIEGDRDLALEQGRAVLASKNFRVFPENERKLFRDLARKHDVSLV